MNQLNVFQILKNGTSFKSIKKDTSKKLRKSSVDSQTFEKFHLQKYNVDDSESEKQIKIETKRRRKESIDQLELDMVKKQHQHQERINKLLKLNKIRRSGDNIPNPCSNFTKMMKSTLNVNRQIISNVKKAGYLQPTPIQMQAIPVILQNRNVIAVAPTGSGKTAAFAIPILQLLGQHKRGGPRCLLFSPSLELGLQLFEQLNLFKSKEGSTALRIKLLSKMNRDKIAIRQSLETIDILICSPLKFLKTHIRSPIDMQIVEYLIMDESDKYFELGLLSQIKQILGIAQGNPKLTYLLFSATIQDPVEKLFQEIMIDPITIQVGGKNHVLNSIDQQLSYCSNEYGKLLEIQNLINNGQFTPPVLMFVQSKERAEELLRQIKEMKIHTQLRIDCIHGNKESTEREQLIKRFESGDLWILICTDLMARGIDFKGVQLVINYDFPNSMINYIHRVGRTGRAGTSGKAITFFTDDDKPLLRSLANVLKISGCQVPEWIFTLRKLTKVDLKHAEKFPIRRESINESRAYTNYKKVKYQDE